MKLKSFGLVASGTIFATAASAAQPPMNLAIFCNSVGHGASSTREWVRVELSTYSTIRACDAAREAHMANHPGARDRFGGTARTQCSQVD